MTGQSDRQRGGFDLNFLKCEEVRRAVVAVVIDSRVFKWFWWYVKPL